jgi:branched-chain amino acid transport system ATP-binding protein
MIGSTLSVRAVQRRFGGLVAVADVSLMARPGEILGIIGQNGAGKTTLFNTIAGTLLPSSGQILIDEEDVTFLPAWRRSRLGIARTFQIPRPISSLSVRENVQVGLVAHGRSRAESAVAADSYLTHLGLGTVADSEAAKLSPGQLRLLEFARAAALEPRVLLLDEVFAGLSHTEQQATSDVVISLKRKGIAIIWIEHHVRLMMSLADRVAVMDQGRIIGEGTPAEVARDERVISAYLGGHTAQGAR